MIFLLLHWSLNKLCVYFQATMAFLYSVFHILVSCLWSQIKSFMGHEVYFCIILWFRTDRAVITSFDFGAYIYFYSSRHCRGLKWVVCVCWFAVFDQTHDLYPFRRRWTAIPWCLHCSTNWPTTRTSRRASGNTRRPTRMKVPRSRQSR